MANHEGFNSSEIMYPAVTTAPDATQSMVPAGPFVAGGGPMFGGPIHRGPELLHESFNQKWLMNCLRRRWVSALLLGVLVSIAAGVLLLWLFPLSSSVTALVLVQEEQNDLLEDNKRFNTQELETFQETQAALIKSQFVLQSALQRPNIAQLDAVVKEEPDPITWLQDELQVGFQGETMMIRFDGEEDHEEMKKLVDAVLAAYEAEVLTKGRLRSAEIRNNLTAFHTELSKDLKVKIEQYESLSATMETADSKIAPAMINMLVNEIRQIQGEIIKQKEQLMEANIHRAVAEQQLASSAAIEAQVAAQIDEDPMVASYKAEEFAMIQQLRALKARSKTGTSPEIRRLESSIVQIQQELANYMAQAKSDMIKELKNTPNPLLQTVMTEYMMRRNNITQAIAQLEAELEEKKAEVRQKGEGNPDLAILQSEIEQLQEIESDLKYKLQSWRIRDQASEQLFQVLQPATALERINTIQRYTIAALGGIAAFCATCYGVALVEFRRRKLNGASDMDEGLGLRVLGVLPAVSSRKAMAPGSMLAAQVSESIDNVRATLMHDSTTRKRQVVLVTSPATMEGTTTVASHLALSLTRAGRRTLLIDGDVREPSLHKLFGMPLDEGLCELLRSDIDIADAVRPTNTEGLWLLTAGHCDMDAIHAMATDQPQPIFEKLREEFDFIIIDGAPVLGLSDSISLGQHVDGAILTVLRDHSEVRKIYQAIELMKSMGIRLIGSVVNGVPLKADRRIAHLHKSTAKRPAKIASSSPKKSSSKRDAAPVTSEDDITADFGSVEINNEIDIDFDDLGLDKE